MSGGFREFSVGVVMVCFMFRLIDDFNLCVFDDEEQFKKPVILESYFVYGT